MKLFWNVLKLAIYYLIYQLGSGLVFALVFALINLSQGKPVISAETPVWVLVWSMLLSEVLMIWHLVHFKYVRFERDVLKGLPTLLLIASVVWVAVTAQAVNIICEWFDLPNDMADAFLQMGRDPLGILSMTIIGPVLEEMLFRGGIEGWMLRSGKSPAMAIVISALIFGLIHMNPVQIPFAFVLGLLFGWLYYRTGSLLPAILGHILNNSLAVVMNNAYGDATTNDVLGGAANTYILLGVSIVLALLLFLWLNKRLGHAEFLPDTPEMESTKNQGYDTIDNHTNDNSTIESDNQIENKQNPQ